MVWKLMKLRSIVDSLKAFMSLNYLPNFVRYSVEYIGSCVEKAVRYQKDIVTKRLDRRRKRKLDGCKQKVRRRSSKCTCSKCTGFRYVQKKRVIEPDFLANLAYSQRVSRGVDTSMDNGDPETVGEIAMDAGETWWKNVINQSRMPALYRDPPDVATRSECSSATSVFRSGVPHIFVNALDVSRSCTPLSPMNDEFFPDDMDRSSQPREGSKSDSKMLPGVGDKATEVGPHATRSASTKTTVLGASPKDGRSSTPTKRKPERRRGKRSSARTTGHANDSFSTCVNCSRILYKAV